MSLEIRSIEGRRGMEMSKVNDKAVIRNNK